jgi:hypothetical protein
MYSSLYSSSPLAAFRCQQNRFACGLVALADRPQPAAGGCLSLPLLVTRVRADDAHDPVAPDDLAVAADLLH